MKESADQRQVRRSSSSNRARNQRVARSCSLARRRRQARLEKEIDAKTHGELLDPAGGEASIMAGTHHHCTAVRAGDLRARAQERYAGERRSACSGRHRVRGRSLDRAACWRARSDAGAGRRARDRHRGAVLDKQPQLRLAGWRQNRRLGFLPEIAALFEQMNRDWKTRWMSSDRGRPACRSDQESRYAAALQKKLGRRRAPAHQGRRQPC